jgi:hypothetical protein
MVVITSLIRSATGTGTGNVIARNDTNYYTNGLRYFVRLFLPTPVKPPRSQ